jgi:hypothetical protein
VVTTPSVPGYSLQQAQRDIASVRGQIAHLQAFAEFLQVQVDTGLTIGSSAAITFPGSSSGSTVLSAAADGHLLSSNVIEIADTSAPATPSTGTKVYSASGNLHYVGEDGNDYDTGRITALTGAQTISSQNPTFTAITGLTVPVGAGVLYRFAVKVFLTANASAGQWQLELLGPSITSLSYAFRYTSAAGVSALNVNVGAFSTVLGGPAASVAGAYWAEIYGEFRPSASGNLSVSGSTSAAADTWAVRGNSYIEILPVT